MKTQIIAYTHNSCKQNEPIPMPVKYLNYCKNKRFEHEINPTNIDEFFSTKSDNDNKFTLSFFGGLTKGNEMVFNDEFVDFIHISYKN